MQTDLITKFLAGSNLHRIEMNIAEYCKHDNESCKFGCVGLHADFIRRSMPKDEWDKFVKENCPGFFKKKQEKIE